MVSLLLGKAFCLSLAAAEPFRREALPVPQGGKTGFTLLKTAQTGISFSNLLTSAAAEQNRILENGSGVALGDIDLDGRCDIYFCGLQSRNTLYRNLGNLRFEDVTSSGGVECAGQYSTGAVFADVDGNGTLDLLVNSLGGGTRLFRNDGRGHFTEDANCGLLRTYGSTSLALADIDGDGDLDLYVANYRTTTIRDEGTRNVQWITRDGVPTALPEERFRVHMRGSQPSLIERGEPDVLYLNDGSGRFTPVSWTDGRFLDASGRPLSAPPHHWSLSVMLRDLNGDGFPDIYVCNDFLEAPDDCWINDGHGRFRALDPLAMRNSSWSSMSVDVADIDRDGYDDIFVVDMLSRSHRLRQTQRANSELASLTYTIGEIANRPQSMRNTLFHSRHDGTFAEIAQLAGVSASDWSWSAAFLDVDLDGYEDILVTNGNMHDILDADTATKTFPLFQLAPKGQEPKTLLMYPPLLTAHAAFRNTGRLTFEETGAAWGFNTVGIAHGMAFGDLDNDGDLDVVVNNLNAPAGLYRNDTPAPRVAVRLRGPGNNTEGIGARVMLSGKPAQSQVIISGGRYLSGDQALRVFAAPVSFGPRELKVKWPDGSTTTIPDAIPNSLYTVEPGDTSRPPPNSSPVAPLFADVSRSLGHSHFETPFDDFYRQPLLPVRLSQLGPGVAWIDLDGDGWDDLIVGTGRGGDVAIFKNERGTFTPWNRSSQGTNEISGLAGFSETGPNAVLLAGLSNYASGSRADPSVGSYLAAGREIIRAELLPGQTDSVGPLAIADMDGDGSLDLFVGGRLIPGRYPEPSLSRIYRRRAGRFVLDRKASEPLASAGLVSGAVFSDLDGDGRPELILACDCGPIRVFQNRLEGFHEITTQLGLAGFTGRWNGVAVGDFDGDGRLDIVASNWGGNTKYQRFLDHPLEIYFGNFGVNGRFDMIEAYFAGDMNKVVPWRGFVSLSKAIPAVAQNFSSFANYAEAGIPDILADQFGSARKYELRTLDSMIFFNRGSNFSSAALPVEAQFAPAFGITVADFDGDGLDDVFLSQNFFAVHLETSRYDGGRSLLLKGDGRGGFVPVPGQESGLLVYGEQRGCAAADYDRDGRLDLVVTQNGAETKLFHNVGAKPGVRVRLEGAKPNAWGIGAWIRPIYSSGPGPARETHAGSGYWSQDSQVQIFPDGLQELSIRWPGQSTPRQYKMPPGAKEILVNSNGAIRREN